ncbi:Break repair meiotic recombinase recruitment factor 1 [Vulpes lagopus]
MGGGVRSPKAPKNPRLGDSGGPQQSSEQSSLCLPEESEGRSGPVPSAEQRTEEPVQALSSSHDEEAGAPSRLFGQPEKGLVPFALSQVSLFYGLMYEPMTLPPLSWSSCLHHQHADRLNSARRYVPQFAKLRKTATRQAELKEEDLGSGAPKISQETPLEPSAQQARRNSFLWEESLGLVPWEARELDAQTQVDSTHPEHRDQNPMTPVPGSGDPQPSTSTDASPEWETVPLASKRAQDHLLEQGTSTPDGESREGCWVLGYHGQKGLLLSGDAEEKESDQGALQEASTQGGAEADLLERCQEEGDSVLSSITQDTEPRSAAQGLSDPLQMPSKTGREAEQSCSSPRHSSLGTVVITDVSTDPTEPEQRAPEVAEPDEQANTKAPTCPSGKAPDGGCSGALLSCMPLTGDTGCRGEVGWEGKPPGNILGGPAASQALDHSRREPTIGARDSSLLASEMDPDVDLTKVPGLDQDGLGGVCMLPLLLQPTGKKTAELSHESPEQDLEGFSLSLGAFVPPPNRETVSGLSQEARGCQDSIDAPVAPTGWSACPPGSVDQAVLGESLALEPDFVPDSQMQKALEAPDFETSHEQVLQDEQETVPRLRHQEQSHRPAQISPSKRTSSAGDTRGSRLDSCWPGTSPQADGGLLTEFQLRADPTPVLNGGQAVEAGTGGQGGCGNCPDEDRGGGEKRTCVGIKACEAARMEDATDTVQGLVVELSNLNRLIMSAHRDLEAFKRLSYRKARLAGKGPAPYTSKGAGNLPLEERSWRDL